MARRPKKRRSTQIEREIAEALSRVRPAKSSRSHSRVHHVDDRPLFYLSEDQQGGKDAEHIERFDDLGEALDMLARLPAGSITYGTVSEGPQLMIAWAAPAHADHIYWTDDDVSAQPDAKKLTQDIRDNQTPRILKGGRHPIAYFGQRMKYAIADLKKSGYRWG